jgi:regulator of protease activity HflC (stomatin/prohibitin superfamily)
MKTLFKLSLLLLIAVSCTRIDAGYEGILIKQYGTDKGVSNVTLVTGRVTYNPFTEDVEEIPLYVQTMDYEPFIVSAKGGGDFTVDPTISLSIVEGSSPKIYVKYRKNIEEIIETTIYNHVKDAFRMQFNKYSSDDITVKREEFENAVQANLVATLEKEGFKLEQLTSGIKYPPSLNAAIEAKNKAVQDAMKIETDIRSAEAKAKIKIAEARGSAESLVIQAEADAKANKLRQQSLNTLLIQQQFIEKWDGKMPVYGQVPSIFKGIN